MHNPWWEQTGSFPTALGTVFYHLASWTIISKSGQSSYQTISFLFGNDLNTQYKHKWLQLASVKWKSCLCELIKKNLQLLVAPKPASIHTRPSFFPFSNDTYLFSKLKRSGQECLRCTRKVQLVHEWEYLTMSPLLICLLLASTVDPMLSRLHHGTSAHLSEWAQSNAEAPAKCCNGWRDLNI